ncbi:NOP58 family protein [Candidatus Micrarchaeota archaeon]|nr:NOP58 family protein [Candidatus Micrarchaeota archaeon]
MEQKDLLELAKKGVKEAYLKRDRLLIESVSGIDELTKVINLLVERLREWYAIYAPEISIQDPEKYCKIILTLDKENVDRKEIEKLLGSNKANEIISGLESSMGIDFEQKDLQAVREIANRIVMLIDLKKKLEQYQNDLASEICPNLSYLIQPQLAAKFIAQARSLETLAKLPASTVQVLGAEKALFKHLKTHSKPPKHGIIFQHAYISTAPKKQRGKMARAIAAKITIAAKADAFSKNFIAENLKRDLEVRVKQIRGD